MMTAHMRSLEELTRKRDAAMEAAHDAPMNPYRLDADGHRWVEPVSDAWARHSREAIRLDAEIAKISSSEAAVPTKEGQS